MNKPRHIPLQTLKGSPTPGLFVKRIGEGERGAMKHDAHRDDYYMIALITEGRAIMSVDFKEVIISAGEAFIVSPSQVHFPSKASSGVKGWLMGISSEHFTEQEVELTAKYAINASPICCANEVIDEINSLFEMLSYHFCHYPIAVPLALSIKSIVLFYADTEIKNINDRYMVIVYQLKKLLAIKLNKEKSPSVYAGMLNISEVYLNEAIKAVTGMNVSRFIRSQVVLTAKRKLAYTSLSAAEIAVELGYDDYAYFSKLFKKETGLSPTQYRKNLK